MYFLRAEIEQFISFEFRSDQARRQDFLKRRNKNSTISIIRDKALLLSSEDYWIKYFD
jgi:hypothetical protein